MPDPAYQPSAAGKRRDLTGAQVGRFVVHNRLGSGGMGEVYLAEDSKLRRSVALKRVSPGTSADQNEISRLLREGQRASALNHPNIAGVYDVLEENGEVLLVMEYVQGQTLRDRLSGPMKPQEFLPIALECASALAAAHEKGILHSDIKPENIMLTPEGHPKLLDFGVARRVAAADDTTSSISLQNLSIQGPIGGTLAYMAPEVLMGGTPDLRADVFSLGLVFYEMLAGNHPFRDRASTTPAQFRIVQQDAPALPKLDSNIGEQLAHIVAKSLQREPAARYASARPLYADLLALAEGNKPKFVATATQWRPKPLPRMVLALLALLAVIGLALLTPAVRNRVTPGLFSSPPRHIAVLPITAIGDSAGDATLADGLMESLTSKLSNLEVGNESLWVVPASEVRRRKVTDPSEALKTFGANLVVTGTLQKSGGNADLIVNLIDAKTMRQLGSGEFQDRAGDFSALQDSAVSKLANLMKIPLTPDMLRNTGGSVNPAAYELYLKGLGYLQRYDKPGNLDLAVNSFSEATKTDPQFAIAYAGLGEAFLLKYNNSKDKHWLDEASANCTQALKLNDQLAPVRVTIGRINDAAGNYDLALQEFQRALFLEPHNADALFGIAQVYEHQGRIKDAEQMFRKAAALRPDYWDGHNKLGLFYFRQKRNAEAIAEFEKVIALTPDNAAGYINEGATYNQDNQPEKAAQALQKAAQLSPSYAIYANLGQIYYLNGKYAEAAQSTQQALKLNDKDYRLWINLAAAYRWLNHDSSVLHAYRQALPLVEEAAKEQPQDANMQAELGQIYANLGQRDKAISRLNAALALAPGDPDVLSSVADSYEALADHNKAIQYASKALEKGYTLESMKKDPDARALLADPRVSIRAK